jgi:hypothetical protein
MKSFAGLLCLFSIPSTAAFASEHFTLGARLSATVCRELGGLQACDVMLETAPRNVTVFLRDCTPNDEKRFQVCSGKWESSESFGGKNIAVQVAVRKSVMTGLDGNGSVTSYQTSAAVKAGGAQWRYVHVASGERPGLTDRVQIDGETLATDPGNSFTPALELGPAAAPGIPPIGPKLRGKD